MKKTNKLKAKPCKFLNLKNLIKSLAALILNFKIQRDHLFLFYKKVSWPIKVRDNQQLKWKYQSTTIILLVYAKEKKT